MKDLSSFEKTVKGIIRVLLEQRYGLRGTIVGSVLIFGIVIYFIVLPLFNTVFSKKSTPPESLGVTKENNAHASEVIVEPSNSLPIEDTCKNGDFIDSDWNYSLYYKNDDGYYIPNERGRKYLHPPMTYKNKLSATFKSLEIEYIATYQDDYKAESTSAILYLALLKEKPHNEDEFDNKKINIFELNLPEPNRQLIFLKSDIAPEDTGNSTPTSIPPIELPSKISFDGTHKVTIVSNKNKNEVVYKITGYYIDSKNNERQYERKIQFKLDTTDPSDKEYTLAVGTGKYGKLKIKEFTLCD
jgi:hypothetical protein